MAIAFLVLAAAPLARAADGAILFTQNCALCHQQGAIGLAGQFPRLAGRVGPISGKPAGRLYLVDLVTNGMAGSITVDKQPIMGVMPPFAQLPDEDVAALLNYLQTLGGAEKAKPFTAEEVTTARTRPRLGASAVFAERQTLVAAKVIP